MHTKGQIKKGRKFRRLRKPCVYSHLSHRQITNEQTSGHHVLRALNSWINIALYSGTHDCCDPAPNPPPNVELTSPPNPWVCGWAAKDPNEGTAVAEARAPNVALPPLLQRFTSKRRVHVCVLFMLREHSSGDQPDLVEMVWTVRLVTNKVGLVKIVYIVHRVPNSIVYTLDWLLVSSAHKLISSFFRVEYEGR